MHARQLVREYCAGIRITGRDPERLSYPEVETVRSDHHEIHAQRIRVFGGEVVGTILLGAGITPCLAWLDAKRNLGLCRPHNNEETNGI